MKFASVVCGALLMTSSCALALEPPPPTAKKASAAELKSLIDGKKLDVVIFDDEVPVAGTLVWSWKRKDITGTALVDNKEKIKVKVKLSFDKDKACATAAKSKPKCHEIFIDGNKFMK